MITIQRAMLVFLCGARVLAAPANDNFDDTILLTGQSFSTNAPVFGATVEAGEPLMAGVSGGTVWYTFVPPTNSAYLVWAHVQPWFPDPIIQAYRGASIDQLIPIPNNFAGDPIGLFRYTVRGESGEPIHLQLGNRSAATSIEFGITPAPPNDDFANALLLTNLTVSGSTQAASAEAGDIDNKTVWYQWQPSKSTTYKISLRTLSPAHRLHLFDGDVPGRLNLIAQIDTSVATSYEGDISVYVVSSNTYTISVSGPTVYSDQFEFEITEGIENDSFFTPRTIPTEETIQADTTGATREPNEPNHDGTNSVHTLWFEWTAEVTGGHYIETPKDAYPLAGFTIYQGNSINTLTAAPSGLYSMDGVLIRSFRAVAGEKYAIVLHTDHPQTNEFRIRRGAAHDEFENALEISIGPELQLAAPGATVEPEESALHEFGYSVWHRFNAPTNGGYFVQTQGGGYPLVFRGNSLSNLVLATAPYPERYVYGFQFYASAGETLYIAVVDTAGYCLRVGASAPNDEFMNRLPIDSDRMVSSNGWATIEPGEPIHSTNFHGGSLWWSWSSTSSISHRIVATAGFAGALAVYRGSELTELTLVARAETLGFGLVGLDFAPEPGAEYSICLSYLPVWDNPATLTLHTPPPHDQFIEAIQILPENPVTNVIGIATLEPGESWSTNKGSVWYTWTAPSSGPFAFLPGNSTYGYDLRVFTGNTIENLQLVDSLFEGGYSSGVSFRAEEGTTHYFAVALPFSVSPHIISPTIVAGPPNDDIANATELSGMYVSWVGTTAGATTEPGELNPSEHERASVWGRWTAPTNGGFRVIVGQSVEIFSQSSQMPVGSSTFEAHEGDTYWIKVAGSHNAMGPFTLRLGPEATNITANSATELHGTNFLFQPNFWTSFAPISRVNGLWYRWTSPAYGMLNYSLITNDTSGKIAFFHMRHPTVHSNAVVRTADAPWRPTSGSFAVAKDVTYLIVLQSPPTTNIFLSLQLENTRDLAEFSDIMNGGLGVPTVQSNKTYSPPNALQLGPLQPAQSAWIEKTFLGRGTLSYRVAAEGPEAYTSVVVSPPIWGVSYSLPSLPFNWIQQSVKLEHDTNVVRWTLINTFGATTAASAWFDDFEFIPAEPLKPKFSAYRRTDGQFGFSFLVEAHRFMTIDSSTNLVDWTPWTNVFSFRTIQRSFTAPLSTDAEPLFFRVRVSE